MDPHFTKLTQPGDFVGTHDLGETAEAVARCRGVLLGLVEALSSDGGYQSSGMTSLYTAAAITACWTWVIVLMPSARSAVEREWYNFTTTIPVVWEVPYDTNLLAVVKKLDNWLEVSCSKPVFEYANLLRGLPIVARSVRHKAVRSLELLQPVITETRSLCAGGSGYQLTGQMSEDLANCQLAVSAAVAQDSVLSAEWRALFPSLRSAPKPEAAFVALTALAGWVERAVALGTID